jgi:two-component sensor histidine kinase
MCAAERRGPVSPPPGYGSAPEGDVLTKSKLEAQAGFSRRVMRSNSASPIIFRELQHRMANILAVLSANLRLEFGSFKDPGLKEALKRHEKQIVAAADLHRFFARCPDDAEIPAENYFRPLCALLSRSVLAPLGLHCEAFVDKTPMLTEKCELLGLAITELVLNAAKHAFPGDICGRVRIEILEQNAHWCCTVSDNGAGMQKGSHGSGSQITNSLVEALDGQLNIRTGPEGTAVSIVFNGQEEQP